LGLRIRAAETPLELFVAAAETPLELFVAAAETRVGLFVGAAETRVGLFVASFVLPRRVGDNGAHVSDASPAVALIIPALDEEKSIGPLLAAVDRTLVRDVIVGDNGSSDATVAVARAHRAEVVHVAERGYGAACAGALRRLAYDVEIVLFMDADGSDDPAEIPLILEPLLAGRADLVIGSRALGEVEPGALTPQQRFGNWLATRLIARLYGHTYTDLGPFRAIRRELLHRIGMRDRRYGWTVEMQVRALQLDARVTEVPVRYRKRIGVSKISGTVRGVALAGYWILRTIFSLRGMREK
jgi:glycosyltransferase involved in cell wall biosynthesis